MFAAAFDMKAMLWRTSPASTELEDVVLDWLRQMMDLPDTFRRHHLRHRLGFDDARDRRRPRTGRFEHSRTRE